MLNGSSGLRQEKSAHCSGEILNEKSILCIKDDHYYVEDFPLDGDAPKQFIKLYLYSKNSNIRKSNPKTWIPYIAKTAEKWYPHESIIEYIINMIGSSLGLKMNDVQLLKINGQIRFLSKYFLNKNESLIHGAEICGAYLNDTELAEEIANDKVTARELFTFEFISDAIKKVFPDYYESIIIELVKMITFDALVGNNDRHFYNWGVITTAKRSNKPISFSPLYDSSRGLLWNISDENIIKYLQGLNNGGKQVFKYIEKASPRISIESNKEVNHFGLIQFLKNHNQKFKVLIGELSSVTNEEKILTLLNTTFFRFFTKERCILMNYIIKERFKRVREI